MVWCLAWNEVVTPDLSYINEKFIGSMVVVIIIFNCIKCLADIWTWMLCKVISEIFHDIESICLNTWYHVRKIFLFEHLKNAVYNFLFLNPSSKPLLQYWIS